MAYSSNNKIDGLDALTAVDATDVLIVGDQSDSDRAKKITKANFVADISIPASQVSDFDTEVANNSAVTANTAKISFDSTSSNKLAGIEANADVTDATNVASAGALMDSEVTNLAAVKAFNPTDYAPALGANDNYVTDAEKTVIGNTSGTNTGDNAVNSNYSGLVTNATHTGEVTGSGALTVDKTAITGKTAVTAVGADYVLIADTSDSGNLKKALLSDVAGGEPEGTAVKSTGETGASKFLREDGDGTCSWQAVAGGGNVAKVGTPINNQIGVWTGDGTIEGDAALTFDTSAGMITVGSEGNYGGIVSPDATTADTNGGSLSLYGGAGTGTGGGGAIEFGGGIGGDTGNGGIVQFYGGGGGATSGDGGDVMLIAGDAAGGNSNGGNLDFRLGSNVGSGVKGKFKFLPVTASAYGILDFESVATADKTFAFPNASGTLALTTGTSDAVTVGTIELGHASDTTLSRVSAGVVAIEGVNIATVSGTQTITNKRITPRLVTAASYTTDTGTSLNCDTTDQFEVTAQAGALLFNSPSGTPTGGQKLMIRIKDNGTARALTYNAIFRAIGVTAPTTTVVSKTLYMGFIYNATDSKWDMLAVGQEA